MSTTAHDRVSQAWDDFNKADRTDNYLSLLNRNPACLLPRREHYPRQALQLRPRRLCRCGLRQVVPQDEKAASGQEAPGEDSQTKEGKSKKLPSTVAIPQGLKDNKLLAVMKAQAQMDNTDDDDDVGAAPKVSPIDSDSEDCDSDCD